MNNEYLLDTSAIFAFTDNEPGAEEVQYLLRQAELHKARLWISMMSIMEIFYVTFQEKGETDASSLVFLVKGLPLKQISLGENLVITAGQYKGRFRISVADAWIAATAKVHNLILVHKDPELESLTGEIRLFPLEYKQ